MVTFREHGDGDCIGFYELGLGDGTCRNEVGIGVDAHDGVDVLWYTVCS